MDESHGEFIPTLILNNADGISAELGNLLANKILDMAAMETSRRYTSVDMSDNIANTFGTNIYRS